MPRRPSLLYLCFSCQTNDYRSRNPIAQLRFSRSRGGYGSEPGWGMVERRPCPGPHRVTPELLPWRPYSSHETARGRGLRSELGETGFVTAPKRMTEWQTQALPRHVRWRSPSNGPLGFNYTGYAFFISRHLIHGARLAMAKTCKETRCNSQ